jgi:gamma-D-glutamyl-L-lysine dipeptidyl-peptidase
VGVSLQPGQPAVVRTTIATLWARPDAVRAVDGPALDRHADIRRWVSGMDAQQQVADCVLSQLLLGERVLVDEVRPDGWVRVFATEQPAALDPRGYPGWLPADQLAADPLFTEDLVVDTAVTVLHAEPGGAVVLPGVVLGTRLSPVDDPRDGWWPVRVPGHDRPLWVAERDLAPLPGRPPTPDLVLAVARQLHDVVYIWGGVSTYGIDCSGLVHLAWRRFGVRLPRDADDQCQATTPLALGDEHPGDLYLFARPGKPVHHVGFVSAEPGRDGRRHMLHACYTKRRVLDEPLPDERTATLVAVHRVSPVCAD